MSTKHDVLAFAAVLIFLIGMVYAGAAVSVLVTAARLAQ